MMKARLLLITIVFVLFGCSGNDSDSIEQTIFNPTDFKISLKSSSFFDAEIEWTESTIKDNSNLTYDVFLNGEMKEEGLDDFSYRFENLKEATSYTAKVIVNSKYDTRKESVFDFTTLSTPVPSAVVLNADKVNHEQIVVSWESADADLKYDVFLNDVKEASDIDVKSFTFSGLKALTKYSVKIIAKNTYSKTSVVSLDITTLDVPVPLSLSDFLVSVQDIHSNSAIIKWEDSVASDGQSVEYIVYSPDGSVLMNRSAINEYKIEGLNADTKYKYKVVAMTHDSSVSMDAFVSFTTLSYEKPSDFVISVSDITETSAKIFWSASVLSDGGDITYNLKLDGEKKEFSGRELVINNLEPNTQHVIEVEAVSSNNITNVQTKSFTTLSQLSLSDFTFTAEQITQTSVVLKWTDCIASDGQPVEYTVYHPSGSNANSMTVGQECRINILRADTEYTYKVVAQSYDFSVKKAVYVTFRTLAYEKPSDFVISVNNITESSANISWSESVLSDGGEVTYRLLVDGIGRAISDREFFIEDLEANTEHTVEIEARSNNNILNVQTTKFITLPPKVYNLNAYSSEVKERSFVLNWDFEDRPGKLYYDIYFEGKWVKRDLSASSYSFDGLISNTSYSVKVVATDGLERKYEKIIEIKTASYEDVIDFDVEIENQDTYNVQTINIFDFVDNNTARYDDILDMTTVFYLNDVEYASDVFGEATFKNLKVNTEYNYKVKLFYADGTFAVEKTGSFTTSGNTAPVWNGELSVQYTGFSFVKFNKLTASDAESSLKYTYYVNGTALTGFRYVGTTRGDGHIDIIDDYILLSHLTADKDFEFYITAEDEAGEIIKSNTVSFKTAIDATLTFDAQLELVDGVYRLSWDNMGVSSSIDELRFELLVNKEVKHDAHIDVNTELMTDGDKNYITKGLNQMIEAYAGSDVNFIIKIKWIAGETIGYSVSRPVSVK